MEKNHIELIFYSPKELLPFSFFWPIDFVVEFDIINLTKSYMETDSVVINTQNLKSGKIKGQTMQPSIHYYVLSLSEQTTRLYEGFRDKLIDIQNSNFPFEFSIDAGNPASKDTQVKEFFHQTEQHFAHYYEQDPLRLVVVGEKRNLAIFKTLTDLSGCNYRNG